MPKKRPYLGHAVEKKKLRFASVTQIKQFDPLDEGGCPRKWAFQYVFGKKLKKTGALETGIDRAEILEHYLTTGEDVLPPDMQPAKRFFPVPGPDLECERALGDMPVAISLRERWLKTDPNNVNYRLQLATEMKLAAGITAYDVPIDGAADVRHRRQTWVDRNGILQQEMPGTYVACIEDLKMVSRIYPHKVMKGQYAGQTLQAYTKTDAEVCDDTQMVIYARHAIDHYIGMTHARLNLIYGNKNKREADKRGGLISVEQILQKFDRIENVVADMEKVATADKIEDVEPNTSACDAFVHVDPSDPEGKKVLKGCGHRYYCPLSTAQFAQNMISVHKESAMSLFDQAPEAAPPPPAPAAPTAPHDPLAYQASVEEAKKKFAAEEQQHTAPVTALGFCPKCGTPLSTANASKLPNGDVKHIGCAATAAPPPPASPIAVNPPDRPAIPSMLEAAAPVPPQEIAQITDPVLKANVEEHARQHAERAAAEAEAERAAKLTSSVWCATSATKIIISTECAVAGKWTCQCGRSWSLSKLKPIKEGEHHVSVIPRHKPHGMETAAPPVPEVPEKKITIRVAEETPPAPPAPPAPIEAAAPPAPPVPTTVVNNVLVQSGRTSYAEANVANPPRPGNGNGHKIVVENAETSLYRVVTENGVQLSVIAPTMMEALNMAQAHLVEDAVEAIEHLYGEILR